MRFLVAKVTMSSDYPMQSVDENAFQADWK